MLPSVLHRSNVSPLPRSVVPQMPQCKIEYPTNNTIFSLNQSRAFVIILFMRKEIRNTRGFLLRRMPRVYTLSYKPLQGTPSSARVPWGGLETTKPPRPSASVGLRVLVVHAGLCLHVSVDKRRCTVARRISTNPSNHEERCKVLRVCG